jgi:hypothetical protein
MEEEPIEDPTSPLPLSKDYQLLQHQYLTLVTLEEPVSIHSISLPFVTNAIFNTKTNPQSVSTHTRQLLDRVKKQETVERQQMEMENVQEEEMDFDIGGKEEKEEVVRVGLKKGMKSLANVKKLADMGGTYFSSLISKRK